MSKRLTIGMATYDDFDGVYFTLQALTLYHSLWMEDVEIIVVDSKEESCIETRKAVEAVGGRYIHTPKRTGTAAPRGLIFEEAKGDIVLVMDCHVLLWPNALVKVLHYFEDPAHAKDMLHGPLAYDDHKHFATEMKPNWGAQMWGVWHDNKEERLKGEPFEIQMHGLGLFAMMRKQWPGFNPHFRGFGGEEGYIHEKVRQAGGKVICHPGLVWTHRFQRPRGVPYKLDLGDRFFNYMVGFRELGLDDTVVREQFLGDLPVARQNAILAEVNRLYPSDKLMSTLKSSPKKILGCFYTDNHIHREILQRSMNTIINAASHTYGGEIRLAACTWQLTANNADRFAQFISHLKVRSHHTMVSQILRNIYETAAWRPDYICFLEHDVLYPPNYFDRVFKVFEQQPKLKVVANGRYIGVNQDGWQKLIRDDNPLHQLSMTATFARQHFESMLRRTIMEHVINLEPEGSIYRLAPADPPAIHVNHAQNFTGHGECYASADETDIPYWGNYRDYYPEGERSPYGKAELGTV